MLAGLTAAALLTGSPPVLAAVDPLVLQAEAQRAEVIARIMPPTVAIFAADGGNGGSGVLIRPDGLTVTNFHVVSELGPFMKCGLNDGRIYDAVLTGIDPTGDVALIRLLGRDDFPVAEFGDSDTLAPGDWVYVVGNPFLLATDFQPTVTYGIVSGTHRYQYPAGTILEYTDCVQVDASINPGNSGGPLFDSAGRLVGINGRASFEKRGRVNSGAGYAISINQVLNFLDHLGSGRIVDHATLGATVRSETDGSVVVDSILEQSDAYRRGLRRGDELVSFAGRPIRSVNQFKNLLGIYPKGWMRPLVYRREGEKHEIQVALRGLHRASELRLDELRLSPEEPPAPERPGQPQDPEGPQVPDSDGPHPLPQLPGHLFGPAEPDIPEGYVHLYEEREGFANYAVNVLHQQRLLARLSPPGTFSAGTWKIAGRTSAGEEYLIQLHDGAAALTLADDQYFQALKEDFTDQPPESGGLLAAFVHWRMMLLAPLERFTEFYYLGSEPLDGTGDRVDVLVGTRGTSTSRWYFRPADAALLGFDTEIEPDVDPCRIRFLEWGEFDGRPFVRRFSVHRGPDLLGEFQIESCEITSGDP
jgi:S1-C subfamily serine protease